MKALMPGDLATMNNGWDYTKTKIFRGSMLEPAVLTMHQGNLAYLLASIYEG